MMFPLFLLLYLWAFWALYVLVMGLYRAHMDKRLGPVSLALGLPFVALGYVADVVTNCTIAALVFLELPQELLVTSRLTRYIKEDSGWRCDLSRWLCTKLLDPFDPNQKHCTP